MNPGLAVTLRPVTPWRIGPDSGVRNRVDSVFHSDTLYSAVTSAMARLGHLEDWLAATARAERSAVGFSSCFPFIDGVRFVAPPRHVWPPVGPAMLSARVRWKSAKFVPLNVVRDVLAGKTLKESKWMVDGVSGCLLPDGSAAPFRTSVRWSAAVDRLTGATDRHSVACTEFRPGSGLWTLVSFAHDTARDRWLEPVKAAFRLLADSGFGGERSRGWGRTESPEFSEGQLPEMILGHVRKAAEPVAEAHHKAEVVVLPVRVEPDPAPEPEPPAAEMAAAAAAPEAAAAPGLVEAPVVVEAPAVEPPVEAAPLETSAPEPEAEPAAEPAVDAAAAAAIPAPHEPALSPVEEPLAELPPTPVPAGLTAHWLLSLFTPGAADAVDWSRGNYSLVERGGRIDSPTGAGELKKQLRMIAEGSVVYASTAPCGGASDVAPDGFAHPVFHAGFAVAIPLGEVTQ